LLPPVVFLIPARQPAKKLLAPVPAVVVEFELKILFVPTIEKVLVAALNVFPLQHNPYPAVILEEGVSQKLFQFVVEAVNGILYPEVKVVEPVVEL